MKLFIYGTLKTGYCRHHVLEEQTYLGEARTAAKYRLVDTGSYPALVEDPNGLEIEGQLWDIDPSCLDAIDALEGAPDLFKRKPVALKEPSEQDAQTYIYQHSVNGLADSANRWG